jgi:hypothetical protein
MVDLDGGSDLKNFEIWRENVVTYVGQAYRLHIKLL